MNDVGQFLRCWSVQIQKIILAGCRLPARSFPNNAWCWIKSDSRFPSFGNLGYCMARTTTSAHTDALRASSMVCGVWPTASFCTIFKFSSLPTGASEC